MQNLIRRCHSSTISEIVTFTSINAIIFFWRSFCCISKATSCKIIWQMVLLNKIAIRNYILYIQCFTRKVLDRVSIYSIYCSRMQHTVFSNFKAPSCTADPTEITLSPGSNFISLASADEKLNPKRTAKFKK